VKAPVILTPFGEYQATLNRWQIAHDEGLAQITKAAEVLSDNVELWRARLEAEKAKAWTAYQAALKAAH
jgi:hypothetical protein